MTYNGCQVSKCNICFFLQILQIKKNGIRRKKRILHTQTMLRCMSPT